MSFMLQSTRLLDVFVPPFSPAVVLAFLGAGALISVAAVGTALALAGRHFFLAKLLVGAGLGVAAVYAALLFGAALFSRERTLTPGEKKYFCEIDCHLAYSIAGTASPGPGRRAVTITTWFDPSTIASFRGNALLTPNPRVVYLVDEAGRRYSPSAGATREWERRHGSSTPLTRALAPGEAYTTTFVFELPQSVGAPRLYLGDPLGVETLLIGHENSPTHRKAYFALPGEAL
jgi:hypothetical protein